jgi:hypothetical protein
MSTIMQLKRLIDVEFDMEYRDRYNTWCYQINEQNLNFIRFHYLCERTDTEFWKDCTSLPLPTKLKNILDKNNALIPSNDSQLFNMLELEEASINELTFYVNNYSAIFVKNKNKGKKQLL